MRMLVREMRGEKTLKLEVGLSNHRAMARSVYMVRKSVEQGTVHTVHDVMAGAAVVFQSNGPRPTATANER
jgi:predicted lysophospholipase L1 biosynthesis ABC-type transport system permease subunit